MARRHDNERARKEPPTVGDAGATSPLDRRSYLKIAGSAAVASAAAAGGAAAAITRQGIEFDREVHAVDDLGLDPTGGTSITDALEGVPAGTLVNFPDGEYRIAPMATFRSGNVGLQGVGDDVRMKPPDGTNGFIFNFDCNQVLFQNIDVDLRADGTNAGMVVKTDDGFHVEDVEWLGRGGLNPTGPPPSGGETNMMNVAVRNSGAVATIRNVVARRISVVGDAYPDGRVGLWAGQAHRGTLRIVDCDFREARNNAIYASRNPGAVQVENSYFENNNVASIRISGDESWAKNCTVVADVAALGPTGNPGASTNIRGTIFEQYRNRDKPGPVLLEDCTFEWRSLEGIPSQGAIHVGPSGRSVVVRNCQVDIHTDGVQAVLRRGPSERDLDTPEPRWLRADGLTVTGSAADSAAVEIRESDGSAVRNSCIAQDGSSRDGVVLEDSDSCEVADSAIDVTGTAVELIRSSADTRNISEDASCSSSSGGGDSGDDDGSSGGGDSGDGTTEELPRVITIHGDQGKAGYEFTVSDALEKTTEGDATIDDGDVVEGTTATGDVWGGRDSYRFAGEITAFDLTAPATVTVDGEEVDPGSLGELPHTLVIDGGGTGERKTYEFAVDGHVEKDADLGTVHESDAIHDDGTVEGFVRGGRDGYRFSGGLTGFSLEGDATVILDGEQVDPSALGAWRVLTVHGDYGKAGYEFTVSGDLEKSLAADATIDDGDAVEGPTATGDVWGGRDSYRFTGELAAFSADAPVRVTVDGEDVDDGALDDDLPHHLLVEGGSDDEPTSYRISVSGDLQKGSLADDADEVDGSVADGVVRGGTDDYRFSGVVTRLRVDGDAALVFDG